MISASAQERYLDEVFYDVSRTRNVKYASAEDLDANAIDLRFDLYEPEGDTLYRRPVFVFLHGGGFDGGNKALGTFEMIKDDLVRRGYIFISAEYRTGVADPKGVQEYKEALYRGVQDAGVLVRFLIEKQSKYRIDPNFIYLGGVSAGATIALHCAFWDSSSIISNFPPSYMQQYDHGVSELITGVINLWGGILNIEDIGQDESAVWSIHGLQDDRMPIDSGKLEDQITIYGGRSIYNRAVSQHLEADLSVFKGLGHGFDDDSSIYVDSVSNSIVHFLYKYYQENAPEPPVNIAKKNAILIGPNPASDQVNLFFDPNRIYPHSIQILDFDGRIVKTASKVDVEHYSGIITFNTSSIPAGLYLLRVNYNMDNIVTQRLQIQH